MGYLGEEGQRGTLYEADSCLSGVQARGDLGKDVPARKTPQALLVLKKKDGMVSRAHRKRS